MDLVLPPFLIPFPAYSWGTYNIFRNALYKTDEHHCREIKYEKVKKRSPVTVDQRVSAFFCLCAHVGPTKWQQLGTKSEKLYGWKRGWWLIDENICRIGVSYVYSYIKYIFRITNDKNRDIIASVLKIVFMVITFIINILSPLWPLL